MAAVTVPTPTWNTTGGNTTVVATPAVGDAVIVIAGTSGLAGGTTAVSDNQTPAGVYQQVQADATGFSTTGVLTAWVRTALITAASSTTFTASQGSSSGGGLAVLRVSGISIVGLGSIRGAGIQSTIASGTPAPILLARLGDNSYSGTQAALTGNVVITAVMSGTSGGGTTARSSPAYTDVAIAGYTVPATGFDLCYIASGETASTITWGGAAPSQFASIALELDASVPQYDWVVTGKPDRDREFVSPGAVGRAATR